MPGTCLTNAEYQKIVDLYREGRGVSDIGRIMQRSKFSVIRVLKRRGAYTPHKTACYLPTPEEIKKMAAECRKTHLDNLREPTKINENLIGD